MMGAHCPQLFANAISALFRWLPPLLIVFCTGIASAQDIQYAQNTTDQNKRSSLTVDPASLGMTVQIPLGGYPGRAGASLPIVLQNSSKVWHMEYGGNAGLNPHANGWVYPAYEANGGWTMSLSPPSLKSADLSKSYTVDGGPECVAHCVPESYTYMIYRIEVHMPDGSAHEVRKDDAAVLVDSNHPYNSDGTYYAVDGSRLRLECHTGVNAPPNVLYLPDGSRYVYASDYSSVSYIDRNGNTLVYNLGSRQWTDTLGRVIGLPLQGAPSVGDSTYLLPGIGNSSVSYTLRWKRLGDALTDPNQALRYVATYSDCDLQTTSYHSPSLFSTGTSCDGDEFYNQLFNPVLLSEVVLPNGKSYKFTYNVYGEMDKIVYPTGGYERFQYDTIPLMSYVRGFYSQANRGVVDHWISVDGSGTDEGAHHWHYAVSYPNNTPPYKVTMTAPDGTYTERYLYSSTGLPSFGFEDRRVGRAYDERVYSASGAMLRRTLTDWVVSGSTLGGNSNATRNPRVAKSVDIVLDTGTSNALVKTTIPGYDLTYQFDVGADQTSVAEYDWATTDQSTAQTAAIAAMPLGALVCTTQTSFLTSNVNYRSRNILGLPGSATVYKGAPSDNIVVAQSSVSYDEYSLTNPGSVASWTDPQTVYRGNATTTSHWLNTSNTYLQTHASYDQFCNVRTATDAKGNQSQLDYSSTYQYAYPTTKTTAVPDPSGAHGSNATLSTTANYDLNTGSVLSTTDANNVTSTVEYNDPLIRPTRTVHASGNGAQSQSPISYDDTNRVITGRSDLNSFNDAGLKAETVYDGLGRAIETRTYEGGTNYIAVQTQYDAMGRAFKVSNPFRPWNNETPIWTRSAFDDLGRVISVTTPDGAAVTTSYSGNTVTVTDQAGKKRRSVTDALGRLIRVDEPDTNGNLDDQNGAPLQPTYYSYDTLDNLIQVTQGSQPPRTFAYDSLKRLTSATNPESGTINYQYDENGNLTQRTDARNITTTYAYDALNRTISRTYNDNPQTPTINYFYDSASLPSGAPTFDRGYANGRLVAVTYGGGSAGTYRGYDALGRVVGQYQQTDSVNYQVEASYNLAGAMISETYPAAPGASDRRTVTYSLDSANRLSSVSSSGTSYAPGADVSAITYAAHGALASEYYAYNTHQTITYNNRLQPAEIKLALDNTRTPIVMMDLQYGYGTTDNNGNVQSIAYSSNQAGISYTQNFSYDSLNRLSTAAETWGGNTSWSQTDGYDQYGNRWIDYGNGNHSLSFSVSTNRITTSGYSYDSAGNLLNDTLHSYTYDAENKISTVDSVSAYVYDGEGQRVRKLIGENTRFVYGIGGKLVAEFDGSTGSLTKEYVYGAGGLLATIEPTSVNTNGTRYVVTDHLGTPRVTTNSSGLVVSRHDYLPFGEELFAGTGGRTTAQGYSASDGVRQHFTGQQRDSETGLDYFVARYHSSAQGRFTGPDSLLASAKPIMPQSWNRYAYCNNNPLIYVDPTGLA